MGNLITNRLKKAKAGNWGHPNNCEKGKSARLVPDDSDTPSNRHKKKKKARVNNRCHYWDCPFCGEPLLEKEEEVKGLHLLIRWQYEDKCRKCGAYEVSECPACKHRTWYKDGIYKHAKWGCGFKGKRLER